MHDQSKSYNDPPCFLLGFITGVLIIIALLFIPCCYEVEYGYYYNVGGSSDYIVIEYHPIVWIGIQTADYPLVQEDINYNIMADYSLLDNSNNEGYFKIYKIFDYTIVDDFKPR